MFPGLEFAMLLLRLFVFIALVAIHPVIAAESPWVAVGQANPECTCRFKGADVSLGTQACVATAQGMRLAECVMEQNVTSWRPGQDLCPVARSGNFTPRLPG